MSGSNILGALFLIILVLALNTSLDKRIEIREQIEYSRSAFTTSCDGSDGLIIPIPIDNDAVLLLCMARSALISSVLLDGEELKR